ncbi:hypothetical protein DFQ29_005455 [Apophysomyces sp. BC1021]|nr:hypothetical protein DFQ29_005455 [Apophysomyces sp. BC1021]
MLDDTLKMIECSANTVNAEAARYKRASFATFRRREVLGIQVICDNITLTSTRAHDAKHWCHIQVRSGSWNERAYMVKVFELLATCYRRLLEQKDVTEQLINEGCGLVPVPIEESIQQVHS